MFPKVLGKLLGAGIGYWFFNLPGAAVGLVCGYFFDRKRSENEIESRRSPKLTPKQTEAVRQAFFTATFSIMGHVAKSDGQVRPAHIKEAESVMERMQLNTELRTSAKKLFNQGKHPDFQLDRNVKRFRDACANSAALYRAFLELQIQVALADGFMSHEEEARLLHVARVLGYSEPLFRQIEVLVRMSLGLGDNHNNRSARRQRGAELKRNSRSNAQTSNTSNVNQSAYQILGVKSDDSKATVKAAYRKLINQHHPDKLVSKGLPEAMLRVATDKTQEIQRAYEQIKMGKGW